jgi:CheY-like chemotaxis protein
MRFIRAWEKDHQVTRVPALALTAYADEKNRRKALQCGFDNVLTKPVDLEKLLRTLAQFSLASLK